MNLEQIKQAIEEGKKVFWKQNNYQVVKADNGEYLIECENNKHCIGLTWTDGKTLNGEEIDFYTEKEIESYTQGGWEIQGENINGEILIGSKELGKNNTGKIVKVGWDICGKDSNEWRANARLIAAAPELLKQLQFIVNEIETTPDELMEALLGLIKLTANKAIEKATKTLTTKPQ